MTSPFSIAQPPFEFLNSHSRLLENRAEGSERHVLAFVLLYGDCSVSTGEFDMTSRLMHFPKTGTLKRPANFGLFDNR